MPSLFPVRRGASLTAVKDGCARPPLRLREDVKAGSLPMPPTEMNTPQQGGVERVPVMQRILDNPFLLLFLGVTLPTVLYLIWGVMEVASIPLAK
jgi:hypothetical protein